MKKMLDENEYIQEEEAETQELTGWSPMLSYKVVPSIAGDLMFD